MNLPASSTQDEMQLAMRKLRNAFITVAVFSGFLNVLDADPFAVHDAGL